jgi:anti-anti-sigma regulatory factor
MFWAVQSDERRICLLGLEGSLNGDDLANLAGRLRGLAAQGVLRVVVDLRNVTHWDYRGLRCLSEAVRWRRERGGITVFVTPSRYLRDIAVVGGVHDDLEFFDDLQLEEGSVHRVGFPATAQADSGIRVSALGP